MAEEILTDIESAKLSTEIRKVVRHLNQLLDQASFANLKIELNIIERQNIGTKWPRIIIDITVLKEV